MRRFIIICLALFAWVNPAFADEHTGLEAFIGSWVSTGDAFGQPARSMLSWSSELNGKFYRLDYQINQGAPDFSSTIFEGIGYYQTSDDGQFKAFWADSSGFLHPIRAELKEDTLISLWGVAGKKLGRTEYTLETDGTMIVTDWIMRDYTWHQFNQNTFIRQKD